MASGKIDHPGEIIGKILEELNISQRAFAMHIGITPASVSRLVSGKSALTPAMALRTAAALGGEGVDWLGLQNAYDLYNAVTEMDPRRIQQLKSLNGVESDPREILSEERHRQYYQSALERLQASRKKGG